MVLMVSEVQALHSHSSDITSCDFSKSHVLATASSDKTVRLWNWTPGLGFVEKDISPLLEHKYGVTCVTFSPQGTVVASCSIDGTTVLWRVTTGRKIHKFTQVNGDPVRVCRFSSDSSGLVSAGDNGIICVWDIIQRTLVRVLQHHEETVHSAAFTPDSSFLVTSCSQGVIKVYSYTDVCDASLESCSALISMDDTHDLGVLSCNFSPVIQIQTEDTLSLIFLLVTCGNDLCLRLWKLTTGNNYCTADIHQVANNAHSSSVTCVRFNETGDLLCSSSMDRSIKIWDSQLQCLLSINAHTRYITSVCFSRNGDMLCSGSNDKSIKVWDLSGGRINIDSEISFPCKLFSHFGVGDLEGIAVIDEEDLLEGKGLVEESQVVMIQKIQDLHSSAVNSLEFNEEGLLATGSSDNTARLLRVAEDEDMKYEEVIEGSSPFATHEYQVSCVHFIGSNVLATCSLDGNIHLWALGENNGCLLRSLTSVQMSGVKCMKATLDGGLLLGVHDDGSVSLWNLESALVAPHVKYEQHAEAATCCAISWDSKIAATASHNGDLRIYALEYGITESIHSIDCAHDLGVLSMDFAMGTKDLLQESENIKCYLLATCGNDYLAKVWLVTVPKDYQLQTLSPSVREQLPFWLMSPQQLPQHTVGCEEWRTLAGHGSNVQCVRFMNHRCDVLCTTSADRQARVWWVTSSQCLHVLEHDSLVTSCCFSTHNDMLATGCITGEVCLWKMPQHLQFSPSSNQIISLCCLSPLSWSPPQLTQWLQEVLGESTSQDTQLNRTTVKILSNQIDGRDVITAEEDTLPELLNLDPSSPILLEVRYLRLMCSSVECLKLERDRAIPHHLLCPLTHTLMLHPLKCADGFTYQGSAIQEWIMQGGRCVSPMTGHLLLNNILSVNTKLREQVLEYLQGEGLL